MITPKQFLDRVIHEEKLCEEMEEFDAPLVSIDDDDELTDEEMPMEGASSSHGSVCKVCFVNNANIVILPCNHIFFCEPCFRTWEVVDTRSYTFDDATAPLPLVLEDSDRSSKCPQCRGDIENHIKILWT